MLVLLATALLLTCVLGDYLPFCCFPSQMYGHVNVTKAGKTWFMAGARFAADFDHERIMFLHPTRNDVFILEIGHGELSDGWRYHRDENGTCTKEPIYSKEEIYACLPDERTDLKKNTTDNYGWPLITWEYQEFGKTSQTIVFKDEDSDECEPYEMRRWTDSPADAMVYRFFNMFSWNVDTELLHPDIHDCKIIPHQD